jgi:hypothetical protein
MLGPHHPPASVDDHLSKFPSTGDIAKRVEGLREIVLRLECIRGPIRP